MQFLFSSSQKKDTPAETGDEDSRARIQAAIDRAILMPEVEAIAPLEPIRKSTKAELSELEDVKQFIVRQDLGENAA